MICMALVLALVATACGDPQVPVARSMTTELATAVPEPVPPTPTPIPTPTPVPTPEGGPVVFEPPIREPGLAPDTNRLAVIFDDETQGQADQVFRDG